MRARVNLARTSSQDDQGDTRGPRPCKIALGTGLCSSLRAHALPIDLSLPRLIAVSRLGFPRGEAGLASKEFQHAAPTSISRVLAGLHLGGDIIQQLAQIIHRHARDIDRTLIVVEPTFLR